VLAAIRRVLSRVPLKTDPMHLPSSLADREPPRKLCPYPSTSSSASLGVSAWMIISAAT
jgi:hypothetical protein